MLFLLVYLVPLCGVLTPFYLAAEYLRFRRRGWPHRHWSRMTGLGLGLFAVGLLLKLRPFEFMRGDYDWEEHVANWLMVISIALWYIALALCWRDAARHRA